ncbi:hypothetical protein CCR85_12175 [Rhodothalassium salexigens]|uniref:DUF1365 domain-containing protein n=1 Tax=Rhodothalassium salexigens TaxID=1086 RepID=UPI0019113416|nr:DUF1365 domain-containing protein [Rhodothalassium salexigens]MBK5912246.1 hypothetical protein [Rhodothalassium salexigens]MBK5921433.1 hypothetical protein [Rhodothalassium salexigens]
MIEPALYTGRVGHIRYGKARHAFAYRVVSLWLDVDHLDALSRRLRLFSVDRPNLVSFRQRDHGDGSGDLAGWARARLADAGLGHASHGLGMLCFPRVLGYQFNPIAVFVGYGADGRPRAVLYQVNNTFGDRHCYAAPLDPDDPAPRHRHGADKVFHVSPFNAVEGAYRFRLVVPDARYSLAIRLRVDGADRFVATHDAVREPLTDARLARRLVTHPVLAHKVIGGIHWEALRLFLKGATYHPRPPAPLVPVTPNVTIHKGLGDAQDTGTSRD